MCSSDLLLGSVEHLAGVWEGRDPEGNAFRTTFAPSSAGSAVREVMFPGTPHEMTNMYHMDGASLVMTHYCAAGNQPRMRAAARAGDRIIFRSDGVSNLTEAAGHYMAEMTLIFEGPDAIRQEWRSIQGGQPAGTAIFAMRRIAPRP